MPLAQSQTPRCARCWGIKMHTLKQGWEFDHRLFDGINCFLWLKDQFDHEKDWIPPVNLLKKIIELMLMVNLFKRLMRVIQSRSIFLKDQREWFDHGQSYLKIKKIERSKIKDRKIEFPILPLPILLYNLSKHCSYIMS